MDSMQIIANVLTEELPQVQQSPLGMLFHLRGKQLCAVAGDNLWCDIVCMSVLLSLFDFCLGALCYPMREPVVNKATIG